jgi:protein SCO1/2
MNVRAFLLGIGAWLGIAGAVHAQSAPILRYDQRLGRRIALDTTWTDETGRPALLSAALEPGKPALLVFGYYKCAQLCSLVERAAVDTLRQLAPSVGPDFTFIYLSVDPSDTAESSRQERAASVRAYGRGGDTHGWHYLTADAATIRRAADSAGFHYRYDPGSQQFAHPAGFVVITPSGMISRYFLGLDFKPAEVAVALREATREAAGPSVFNLVLECFQGGRGASRRQRLIWDGLWGSVGATILALGGGIGWMLWQDRGAKGRP